LVSITTLPATASVGSSRSAVATQGNRHDDHVAEPLCLRGGHCLRSATQLLDETRQRLPPTRVADRHLVAGIQETLGECAADVPGADDPNHHFASSFFAFLATRIEPSRGAPCANQRRKKSTRSAGQPPFTGHRAVFQLAEDGVCVLGDVVRRPAVEGERHGAAVVLAQGRFGVGLVAAVKV
jgi:hypothetical protein